jgi:hypothetical protein
MSILAIGVLVIMLVVIGLVVAHFWDRLTS